MELVGVQTMIMQFLVVGLGIWDGPVMGRNMTICGSFSANQRSTNDSNPSSNLEEKKKLLTSKVGNLIKIEGK